MGYPKHLFILGLVMMILAGFVMLSLGWIDITGYMALLVLSLPFYWLETYWRNQFRAKQIAQDKLKILPFSAWSFERLLYFEMILLFLLIAHPNSFQNQPTSPFPQLLASLTFVIGFLLSKYYRERNELQSYQLTKKEFSVFQYGYKKTVKWGQITDFEMSDNLLFIKRKKGSHLRVYPDALQTKDRTYLVETLRGFAQKKGLVFRVSPEESNTPTPWYLDDLKHGLQFLFFTIINLILILVEFGLV